MSQFGLIQLVAYTAGSTLLTNKNNKMICSEELSTYYEGIDGNISIPRVCDAMRELFLIIDLPPLPSDLFWKDNILTHLINCIELRVNGKTITLTKNYIKNLLVLNADKLSNKALFNNLTEDKRKKLSKKSNNIMLPLKLKDLFITEPNEVYLTVPFNFCVKYNISNKNLIETDEEYIVNDIKIGCKFIGVFYDTPYRNYMIHNYETIIQNQKFVLEI
ncbi:capsid protein [Fadolivirus algeromassiliense]|jgi:hypothetical protein|uniref:Capsid protein n=1 Tax=Fadolivirus FV1/VV64 TaxID=3070911 RepID=A0A7D3QVN6_9VIRU|nr:capsid protein [Fadolivirus algeromassiliense]QKF94484.1 capsid protein [Fadolivirus FV1/VV64]